MSKRLYFPSGGVSSGGGAPLPARYLGGFEARSGTRVRLRSSLSQCRSRWSGLLPAGPKTATRSCYADARFVIGIRSLVTAVAASRRTMSIMTGSGFAGAAAYDAEGPSLSYRRFLFLTRITACWRGTPFSSYVKLPVIKTESKRRPGSPCRLFPSARSVAAGVRSALNTIETVRSSPIDSDDALLRSP